MSNNLLITGLPGVGKTTLIRNVCHSLSGVRLCGFYTEEIREKAIRKGFRLVAFSGESAILSHVNTKSPVRVGKYGVDVAGFEEFLARALLMDQETELVVIDEIGKMECLSPRFVILLREFLDSDRTVLATISAHGGGVIAEVRRRADITLYEITRKNRDIMANRLTGIVRQELSL